MELFIHCQSVAEVKARYRELASILHPDVGGEAWAFHELQRQYEAAKAHCKAETHRSVVETYNRHAEAQGKHGIYMTEEKRFAMENMTLVERNVWRAFNAPLKRSDPSRITAWEFYDWMNGWKEAVAKRERAWTEQRSKARGQRLKLLQRWFWRALSDSVMPSIGDNGEFAIGDNGEFVLEPFSSIYRLQRDAMYSSEMEEWASRLTALLTDFQFDHEYVSSYISTVLEISNSKWEDIKLSEDVHPNYKGLIKATFAHLEVVVKSGIDIKVITEALNFLFSKKAVGILSEIVISWLCASCMIKGFQNFEDAIYCFVDPASVGALKIYILNMVINIPWASEFQRLEAEAQQRKDAA